MAQEETLHLSWTNNVFVKAFCETLGIEAVYCTQHIFPYFFVTMFVDIFFFFNHIYCARGTIPKLHIKAKGGVERA